MPDTDQTQETYSKFLRAAAGDAEALKDLQKASPGETPPAPDDSKQKETSDESPLYFPEKYKTRADEHKAVMEMSKLIGRRDDDAKAMRELRKRLNDPKERKAALAELMKDGDIADDNETEIGDDDVVSGKELKRRLTEMENRLKSGLSETANAIDPLLRSRRIEELKARGGGFALIDHPVVSEIANRIDAAESEGTLRRDEIIVKAALWDALEGGQILAKVAEVLSKRPASQLKDKLPETTSPSIETQKPPEQMTPQQVYAAALRASAGAR